RVVLLEEGPAVSRFRKNQATTARYHMQEDAMMVARGEAFVPIAAGRGVGGGSLINSALCFRAPDPLLVDWASRLGDDRFGPQAMGAVYDEISELIGVGVTPEAIAGRNNQLIVRGVAALGLEGGFAPRNTPGCRGCGVCNFGCPSNGKGSMNVTLLPRAAAAGDVRIQADTKVVDVLVEGGRAVGVRGEARHPDTGERVGDVVVRADRVVLSAGAIGTPRLLWHCGLAGALGPVGDGMHIHPGNAVLGVCDEPIHLWRGATQGAWFKHPDLPGALPHTFSAPPEACLLAGGFVGSRLQEGLAMLPYLCGLLLLVSDKGSGKVRATSDGRADLSYDWDSRDVALIKRGMVELARVLLAGGAREVLAPVRGMRERYTDADAIGADLAPHVLADFTMYAAHPMATCRMGLDPATSVVGPDGQARGLLGLYIADTSVFPTALGVNPQLTTMALCTTLGRGMAGAT
ncbi:MAG: GMC family oxidoreductase, partial [Myxococcales bacterium]|nr:GMC family oxidoreductase [Myxococcales bacterium]